MTAEAILTSLNDAKMSGGLIISSKILQHLFETFFTQQNRLKRTGL